MEWLADNIAVPLAIIGTALIGGIFKGLRGFGDIKRTINNIERELDKHIAAANVWDHFTEKEITRLRDGKNGNE